MISNLVAAKRYLLIFESRLSVKLHQKVKIF